MSLISLDIETDGPLIGVNSIVCFGAVVIRDGLKDTFYGKMKPLSDKFDPDALKISGFSRQEHEKFDDPVKVMSDFAQFVKDKSNGQPILISDNNQYDGSWVNYYFLMFYGSNPFGWSSRRINDLYAGLTKDSRNNGKHHRITKHTHNPVDDAKGNAEVVIYMRDNLGLKINLI